MASEEELTEFPSPLNLYEDTKRSILVYSNVPMEEIERAIRGNVQRAKRIINTFRDERFLDNMNAYIALFCLIVNDNHLIRHDMDVSKYEHVKAADDAIILAGEIKLCGMVKNLKGQKISEGFYNINDQGVETKILNEIASAIDLKFKQSLRSLGGKLKLSEVSPDIIFTTIRAIFIADLKNQSFDLDLI